MKCKRAEKWISDRMDGGLSGRRRRILDSHLGECERCRGYRRRLERIQAVAKNLPEPILSPERWENSLSRLESRIRAAGSENRPRRAGFSRLARRWALAGAGLLLIGAVVLYLALVRPPAPGEIYSFSFEDSLNRISSQIGDDAELESRFAASLRKSIAEHAEPASDETKHLLYGDSLFVASLSDEEIEILGEAIEKDLKF
jgi:hypothetical protein